MQQTAAQQSISGSLRKLALSFIVLTTLSVLLAWQQTVWASTSGSTAPAFTLPTKSGQVSLSDLKGKVVLLDFWASWCGPCRQSFPWMNQMLTQFKDAGLEIVAINLDQEPELADAFLKQVPANFTVAFDQEGTSAESYQVMGMPSAYLIDREGKLHSQHIGFHIDRKDRYEQEIRALLAK